MYTWPMAGWYLWQPIWPTPLIPSRHGLAGGLQFPPIGRGGGPIYGRLNPFQLGPAAIDPLELFFRAGNPIGGPAEAFRGVSASSFPSIYSIRGGGAPLSPEHLGLAGSPISI
jgi:hypothetical protein